MYPCRRRLLFRSPRPVPAAERPLHPKDPFAFPWLPSLRPLFRWSSFAWVVSGVDVRQNKRTHPVNLDRCVRLREREMPHLRRQQGIAPGRKILHLRLVERLTHAQRKRPRKDRHVFVRWMPVRRDLVAGRHFQPHDKQPRLTRVPRHDGEGSALFKYWRRIAPLHYRSRREDVCRGLSSLTYRYSDNRHDGHRTAEQQPSHASPPCWVSVD